MLLVLLLLTYTSFLVLLFHYQRREKMYVGYTTVLSLVFLAIMGIVVVAGLLQKESYLKNTLLVCLIITVWVLGSMLIYLMSQLTLAFEKIRQLTQHIAIRETEAEERAPRS